MIFSGRPWTHTRGWGREGATRDGAEGSSDQVTWSLGGSFGFAVEEFSCPRQKNKFIRQNMFTQLYRAQILESADHIKEKTLLREISYRY